MNQTMENKTINQEENYHIHDEESKFSVTQEKEHDVRIRVDKPADFDPTMETQITTSNELSRIINNLFSQAFADYYGCILMSSYLPGVGMVTIPRLYFKVLQDQAYDDPNMIFAFNPVGRVSKNDKNDMFARIQRVSNITSAPASRKVEITDDGKNALLEFMVTTGQKKFDQWDSAFNTIPSRNDTFVGLSKLDITKILRKIFGEVDIEGTPLYYAITPTYNIGGRNGNENWILNIHRLHHGAEARAAELVGLCAPDDSGMPPMVVAERSMANKF